MEAIIIQVIMFQLCFLMVYELLFRKETFFNWNRVYLLGTSVIALVLPFIKLNSFSRIIPQEYAINLPAVFLGKTVSTQQNVVEQLDTIVLQNESTLSVLWIWYAGMLLFTSVLFFKIYKIWRFKRLNYLEQSRGYSVITLKNSEDAFSFFKTIFLGDQIEHTQRESILKHEKVHVKEHHSLDLLWFELLKIVFWFNPLVYIYQKRITEVHEFIADKCASKFQENYYENLLAKTFNVAQFSVVNQFYSSSLIKKRIIMLTKKQSNRILKFKYALLVPVIAGMLVFTSCEKSVKQKGTILENIENLKESIAKNGEVTEEERRAIQEIYKLIADENIKEEASLSEVSFKVLDQAPIFPGCENFGTLEELKTCFSKSISEHVGKTFNTKLADDLNLVGMQKIMVAFNVGKFGEINDIKVRAPHEALAEEAKRVIKALPKLQPGMHQNKAVVVPYALPIVFQVN